MWPVATVLGNIVLDLLEGFLKMQNTLAMKRLIYSSILKLRVFVYSKDTLKRITG